MLRATSGERSSSLLGAIDRTVTSGGARLLAFEAEVFGEEEGG